MKTMMNALQEIQAKKKVVTSVEFDCGSEAKAQEVFDAVSDIVTDHLQEFAKITYDSDLAQGTCKVEITQNK